MKKTKKEVWLGVLVDVISFSLGLLFVYAAASKLMAYDKFVVTIGQSAMLTPYAGVLAWLVPFLEIVIVLMLAFERLRLWGLLASFSLMSMFTAYIFIVVYLMDKKPCGCGGVLEKLGWEAHLIFNISFVILNIIGITISNRQSQLEHD